ncbi:MAG: acetyl-CoA carboxylase biotin carboxyl carrier protein subunit [Tepidiformaceae bacterium]
MTEKYLLRLGDDDATLELEREDGVTRVRREGGQWRTVELERVGDSGLYLLMVDDRPMELYLERRRGGAIVTIGRHAFNYDVGRWRPVSATRSKAAGAVGLVRITAPMTGSIVEVRCSPGETVAEGDVLLVIESMKMNNELRAPVEAVVEAVPVVAAQRVKAGDLLVALKRAQT